MRNQELEAARQHRYRNRPTEWLQTTASAARSGKTTPPQKLISVPSDCNIGGNEEAESTATTSRVAAGTNVSSNQDQESRMKIKIKIKNQDEGQDQEEDQGQEDDQGDDPDQSRAS